jgi:3-oxocholest-4-en-26-oate---CoA ligase
MESVFGILKAGLVPINTNYRYKAEELIYLWSNADAEAVIFHGAFAATIEPIRHRLPEIRLWLHVDDGHARPDWAQPYPAAALGPARADAADRRSEDDVIIIYTGGTTGLPKGVM